MAGGPSEATARPFQKILCATAGGTALLAAVLVNPWTIRLYRDSWFDYCDVALEFAVAALAIAAFFTLAAHWAPRGEVASNVLLLCASLSLVALADRALLVYWGRSPWITDPLLHYRHRPEARHSFSYWYRGHRSTLAVAGADTSTVRINRYGHHDDEFAPAPVAGELRGLIVGDSVTMGHGVDENDTFANQLEEILARFDQRHGAHQVINAGVQGYETGQAAGMFSESLMFGPRFSFIGFCYNDVPTDTTGHFRAYRHDGVRGYGFWLRYLLTETGIGLSVQKFRQYRFARSAREDAVASGVTQRTVVSDPVRRRRATAQLAGPLERIYSQGRERGGDVALLVLPAREQLFQPDLQVMHAELAAHARKNGAGFLDLTPLFEERIDQEVERVVTERGASRANPRVIEALRQLRINLYFLDGFHLTPRGHKLVAWRLAHFLDANYGLGFALNEFAGALEADSLLMGELEYRVSVSPDISSILSACTALEYMGHYRQAVFICERVLAASDHPGFQSLMRFRLGGLLLQLGDRMEAAGQFRHAISTLEAGWPVVEEGAYSRLGNQALSVGLAAESLVAFRRALAVDPQDESARAGLAQALEARRGTRDSGGERPVGN